MASRACRLCLIAAAPLLVGAAFDPTGRVRDRQETIAKLTRDINKVDHTIEATKELLKKSGDAPYIADLYFRLAELHVERSRYVYQRLMEQRPESEKSLGGEKALEVQISKRLAIETYDRILRDYPEYENNDQIRFFKAHEYRELGEWDPMIKEYRDLIDAKPKSLWATEARLILADYYFDKGDLKTAEDYYGGILALPEGHLHDMARYKIGWIRINQERFAESLKLFEASVTSKGKQRRAAIGDARVLNVKREALMAAVWPFSEVRKAKDAPDYFRRLSDAKTTYVEVLNRLANRYYVKTQYQSAALVYREIVKYSADVERNVEFVQRIYESVRNMSPRNPNRFVHAAQDVRGMVDTVARFQTHLKFSDEDKKRLTHDIELRARDLATRLHVQATRRADKRSADTASLAYKRYLGLFENHKERKTMQMNRAEALFLAKRFVEAGLQYEEVAKVEKKEHSQRDVLYSAIVSFFEALDADSAERSKHPTQGGLLDLLERLRAREALKQLGAYYVKEWPSDKNTPNVKFNVARMYYDQGEFEKASELLARFVEQYPTHKDVRVAGNLALDAQSKLENYDALAALAKRFVDNPRISDRAFKNEAAKIGEAARKRKLQMAVIATTEGDFGERMISEWERHKGSAEGEDYLYTAFVKFKSENNIAGVFDFGGRIIGAYPKSKRLGDVLATMALFAVRAADFERAAMLFEEFYKRLPRSKNAGGMLRQASDIRFVLGDYDRAMADLRILCNAGSTQQRLAAHEKLMRIYTNAGDWGGLAKVAGAAAQAFPRWSAARAHLGIAYAQHGRPEQAQRELETVARQSTNSDFDLESKAHGLFVLGQLLQSRFDGIRFSGAAGAEARLQEKMAYLQALEQTYVAAIQTNYPEWAIASLQRMARAYRDFGEFIGNAPPPDGLSAGERQQYKQALGQQREQFVAKAQQTMEACASKASELKVFSEYATACLGKSYDDVISRGQRRRPRNVGDEAYQREMQTVRAKLAKTPESLPLLKQLAKRAMQVGDLHMARLTLAKAAELAPRDGEVKNLLGVALWGLGEVQEAYEKLQAAHQARSRYAALNLAAMYLEYGYRREAQRLMQSAPRTTRRDLSEPGLHPSVQRLFEGASQ